MAFLGILFFVMINARAMDLDEARAKGKVKENASGYIEASSSEAEVGQLVQDINSKRKAHYMELSKKNGQPLSVIEKLAADKIKEKINQK